MHLLTGLPLLEPPELILLVGLLLPELRLGREDEASESISESDSSSEEDPESEELKEEAETRADAKRRESSSMSERFAEVMPRVA